MLRSWLYTAGSKTYEWAYAVCVVYDRIVHDVGVGDACMVINSLKDKESLTAEEVRRVVQYNPKTGVFRWLVKPAKPIAIGSLAGSRRRNKYCTVTINGKIYLQHRLAWLYMTGEWPPQYVDHIDRNPSNNRWVNLRLATPEQNSMNCCGLGFYWDNKKRLFRSFIKTQGKSIHLGYYRSILDARAAHLRARNQYFGEFA